MIHMLHKRDEKVILLLTQRKERDDLINNLKFNAIQHLFQQCLQSADIRFVYTS